MHSSKYHIFLEVQNPLYMEKTHLHLGGLET